MQANDKNVLIALSILIGLFMLNKSRIQIKRNKLKASAYAE